MIPLKSSMMRIIFTPLLIHAENKCVFTLNGFIYIGSSDGILIIKEDTFKKEKEILPKKN